MHPRHSQQGSVWPAAADALPHHLRRGCRREGDTGMQWRTQPLVAEPCSWAQLLGGWGALSAGGGQVDRLSAAHHQAHCRRQGNLLQTFNKCACAFRLLLL